MLVIAFCVRYVETPFLWCPRIPRNQKIRDLVQSQLAQSENHLSSYIAMPVGGTLQMLGLSSINQQVWQVCYSTAYWGFNVIIFPVQLQKYEDTAPEFLEFERLKEHFEHFIRVSNSVSSNNPTTSAHVNPITAAASSALSRDIPGVAKYASRRSRSDKNSHKDELPLYRSRFESSANDILAQGGGESDVNLLENLEDIVEVATLDQRWISSWTPSLYVR